MIWFITEKLKSFESLIVNTFETLIKLLNSKFQEAILDQKMQISVTDISTDSHSNLSSIKWDFWLIVLTKSDGFEQSILLTDATLSLPYFFSSLIYTKNELWNMIIAIANLKTHFISKWITEIASLPLFLFEKPVIFFIFKNLKLQS